MRSAHKMVAVLQLSNKQHINNHTQMRQIQIYFQIISINYNIPQLNFVDRIATVCWAIILHRTISHILQLIVQCWTQGNASCIGLTIVTIMYTKHTRIDQTLEFIRILINYQCVLNCLLLHRLIVAVIVILFRLALEGW